MYSISIYLDIWQLHETFHDNKFVKGKKKKGSGTNVQKKKKKRKKKTTMWSIQRLEIYM